MANEQNNIPATGIKGVRLKRFEQVIAAVLPHVRPSYQKLPFVGLAPPGNDWPFDELPPQVRVFGNEEGQISNFTRANRKEEQIRSLIRCVMALTMPILAESRDNFFTIVDFGGGSGHLAIPLALLLPQCRVIVVDLSDRSLDLLHRKANLLREPTNLNPIPMPDCSTCQSELRRSNKIGNLFTFHGPVERFDLKFDMGIALHLCGEATDVAIWKCLTAKCLVFCPCCVGKLNTDKKNPYIYQATGNNAPSVTYPQSRIFCQFLSNQTDWNALVKAADYGETDESRTSRNATRRTAKALLETDRCLYLNEHGFRTALTRMEPWEATPKNDIILAWKNEYAVSIDSVDDECQADIQWTYDHLLVRASPSSNDNVDWTRDEEDEIRKALQDFIAGDAQILIFPTRLGKRKRKLIHYVAEQLQLAHWCEGVKYGDKTVAVAKKERRHEREDP